MRVRSSASLPPFIEGRTEIIEQAAVRVEPLLVGFFVYRYQLWGEVQHLPKFLLTFSKRLDQLLLLSDIHPRTHESPQSPLLSRENAHTTDASSLSVRPHDSFREVECSMGRQHLFDLLLDEFPIFRMHQGQIFFLCWRVTSWIKSVDLKQFRRPILESGRGKCPAACAGKPLSFCEVELGLGAFFNVEIKPDPIQPGSVRSRDRFGTTEEPPVRSFSVAHAKPHFAGAACVNSPTRLSVSVRDHPDEEKRCGNPIPLRCLYRTGGDDLPGDPNNLLFARSQT